MSFPAKVHKAPQGVLALVLSYQGVTRPCWLETTNHQAVSWIWPGSRRPDPCARVGKSEVRTGLYQGVRRSGVGEDVAFRSTRVDLALTSHLCSGPPRAKSPETANLEHPVPANIRQAFVRLRCIYLSS